MTDVKNKPVCNHFPTLAKGCVSSLSYDIRDLCIYFSLIIADCKNNEQY